MQTRIATRASQRRTGMTLIEVIMAVMILSGVLIGLSNFTRRFQSLTTNHDVLAVASELASARIAAVELHRTYSTIASTFGGTTETNATSSANPSMSGFPGYTRRTTVTATDSSYKARYVTVTVTVTHAATSTTVTKSLVLSAF